MKQQLEDFVFYQRAGYPFYYVTTYEMDRCVEMLVEATNSFTNKEGENPYNAVIWDMEGMPGVDGTPTITPDPMELLDKLATEMPIGTVLIAKNYNWFLKDDYGQPSKGVVTYLQNRYRLFTKKAARKTLVIVGDVPMDDGVPSAIKRQFLPLDFDLPDSEEIGEALDKIVGAASKQLDGFIPPTEQERDRLIDAATGLTLQQVENAFAFCIIKNGVFDPKVIDRIKAAQIQEMPGVTYVEYDEGELPELIGYNNVKPLILSAATNPKGKGCLFVGPPGCGKTTFMKWVGAKTKKRVLLVELAEMQGGIVGDTERNYRDLIRIIRAMAGTQGVIVFFDEIEKGLSGAGGGAQTASSDSITTRASGQLLKFMSDPGCNVYFAATCNDISGIRPEWLRSGRWDTSPIYVGLPNAQEQQQILKYYKTKHEVNGKLTAQDMKGWSGAEIEGVCRLAEMMQISCAEAKKYVVPITQVMKLMGNAYEKMEQLKGTCVLANTVPELKELQDRGLDI